MLQGLIRAFKFLKATPSQTQCDITEGALMKLSPDFSISFRFFSILGVSLDEATRCFHRSFKMCFPFLTVGVCRDQTSMMMVKHCLRLFTS